MTHNTRAAIISAVASVIAALVFVEAKPILQYLSGPNLPGWLQAAHVFLIPAVAYAVAWATHYLLTKDPTPPAPSGIWETPPPTVPKPPAGAA
jgi:hypothetical protein